VPDSAELVRFYDAAYAQPDPAKAALTRAGAVGKADHVLALCARAACALEVSCSDGELHRRGFNGRLSGVEIPPAAVAIAGARPEINSVELYDGLRLEVPTPPILGVLSPPALASWHGEQRGHAENAEQ
jgi:hypothetical protein